MGIRVEVRPNGSRRVIQEFEGESLTEASHQAEVDINEIVSRYQRTGVLPSRGGAPSYGDFTGVRDYHSALDAVRAADAAFMTLPPEIRKRFQNDAGLLLAFLSDPANRAEAEKIGLLERRGTPPDKAGDLPGKSSAVVTPTPVKPAEGGTVAQ